MIQRIAVEYIKLVTAERKPPPWAIHGRIFLRIFDQVYRRDGHGGKKGETRASGAMLANGDKKTFGQLIFVNVLDIPLPRAPEWQFTQEELDQIRKVWPLSEAHETLYTA